MTKPFEYCFHNTLQCMGKECPAPCRTILDNIADGVFTVDKEYKILWFNLAAERITGFSKEEALGHPCYEIFQTELCQGHNCPLKRTMSAGKGVVNFEVNIITHGGRGIPVAISTAPIKDKNGKIIGAVENFRDLSEIKAYQSELNGHYSFKNIISKNAKMVTIFNNLKDIAVSDSTVLIYGESGTGKELIARALHDLSRRKDKPYITINCGAIPDTLMESEMFGYRKGAFTDARQHKPGRFAMAERGTIFLDEIGDLSYELQVKLLRVLQDGEYYSLGGTEALRADVRVITATNKDLFKRIQEGLFREDLYYRINVVQIDVPSLRERKEDIPLLTEHFIEKFNKKMGRDVKQIGSRAYEILFSYDFPGNIRELGNIIEHAIILCKKNTIEVNHLPPYLFDKTRNKAKVPHVAIPMSEIELMEREAILDALRKHQWNRDKTAQALELSRTTLWRKLKKFQLVS
ncbi:MAG: sigma 54-interacting transcriptional regulator [Syntrophales bacterium]